MHDRPELRVRPRQRAVADHGRGAGLGAPHRGVVRPGRRGQVVHPGRAVPALQHTGGGVAVLAGVARGGDRAGRGDTAQGARVRHPGRAVPALQRAAGVAELARVGAVAGLAVRGEDAADRHDGGAQVGDVGAPGDAALARADARGDLDLVEREADAGDHRGDGGGGRGALDDLQGRLRLAGVVVERVVDPQDDQVDTGVGGVAVGEGQGGRLGEGDRVGALGGARRDDGTALVDGRRHGARRALQPEAGHAVEAVVGTREDAGADLQGVDGGGRAELGQTGVLAGLAGLGHPCAAEVHVRGSCGGWGEVVGLRVRGPSRSLPGGATGPGRTGVQVRSHSAVKLVA